MWYDSRLPVELPALGGGSLAVRVAMGHVGNEIEALPVMDGSKEFDVLGMGPHQWTGPAGGPAPEQVSVRPVCLIPDLLREQTNPVPESFKRPDQWPYGMARSQFVMAPLSGQQRPGPALPPSLKWPSIGALTVPIMVVAMPAGTKRRLDLQHGVDHAHGIDNERILWIADPIPHEFQETGIDDFVGRKFGRAAGRLVGQTQHPTIGIFIGLHLVHGDRMDPDVVPRNAGHKPAGGRHGPRLRVAFQEVGVRLDESGRTLVTAVIRVHRRAGQRGDTHCQRRRRGSAGLLPAVLRPDPPLAGPVG